MKLKTKTSIIAMIALITLSIIGYTYYYNPEKVIVRTFCQNIDDNIVTLKIENNQSCQSYFYNDGWLSKYRRNALKKVFLSDDFRIVSTLEVKEQTVGSLTFIHTKSTYRFSSDILSQSTTLLNHTTQQEVKTIELINPNYEPAIKIQIKEQFKEKIIGYQNLEGTRHWYGLPKNNSELELWLNDKNINDIYQTGFLNADLTLKYCANSGGGRDDAFQDCISIVAKEYLVDGILK